MYSPASMILQESGWNWIVRCYFNKLHTERQILRVITYVESRYKFIHDENAGTGLKEVRRKQERAMKVILIV